MEFLGRVRWTSGTPAININFYYEHYRDNADMKYRVKVVVEPVIGQSYFGYSIIADVSMDGAFKVSQTMKNASTSQWSSNIEWTSDWYTVSNKLTGSTSLAIRMHSNGSRDETYYYNMYVDPAGFSQKPKVEAQNLTTTGGTFKWSTSENCSSVKYVEDGGAETSVFSGSATAGTFDITNLDANTSHTLMIKAQRQDSGLWSDSDPINFETSSKTVRISLNGEWKDATPYVRVNGEWKVAVPYTRVSGEWKKGK